MSALARALLDLGYSVSGSDTKESSITEKLRRDGATVYKGHNAANVDGAGLVVYSTAIPGDNQELMAAKEKGLLLWHRSELLAHFINGRYGVAVAGAHGKTTTTSMIASVLTKGNLDPTAFIGGVLTDFGGNARIGKSEIVVAEADESDNTFLRYRPEMAVVTNVEPDHLEHYQGDFNLLLAAYRQFLDNVKAEGKAVLFADDPYLKDMHPTHVKKVITFGLQNGDWRAADIQPDGWGSRFTLHGPDGVKENMTLGVPGIHNVQNALATIAVARELGVAFDAILEGLSAFQGADRRFQFLFEGDGILVVDDYAHHPTEVRATLHAARSNNPKRIIAIFQPHRFSRTKWFLDDFAASFDGADKVFLHRIYAASEVPLAGVSSAELAARMRSRGVDVAQCDNADHIMEQVLHMAQSGDLILTMGAGDVTEMGHTLAARLRERADVQR